MPSRTTVRQTALVAQYETQKIPKTVLQQKLHEWSQILQAPESPDEDDL
jgi:hypothetical protein